jgi:competence protein ComEC
MRSVRILLALLLALCLGTPALPPAQVHAQSFQAAKKEVTVYVTNTGKRYHRANCQYLRRSKHEMTLKDAVAAGYTPCHVCRPPVLKQ